MNDDSEWRLMELDEGRWRWMKANGIDEGE